MQNPQHHDILNTVEQHIQSGQLANAIALLNQALKQSPSFYQGWLKLSQCLHSASYKAQAIDVAKHAEQFDPLTNEFSQIQQLMQQNEVTQAATIAQGMLSKCPHHPRALFTLASISLSQQRPEKCAQLLETELPFVPAIVALRQLLIDSYTQAGQYEKALDAAHKLVELHTSFESLWQWIGLLFKYAQYPNLLAACDRITEFAADDRKKRSQVELMRGQTLRIMGERDKSIEALRLSIEYDPGNADAWWALADFKNYQFGRGDIKQLEALVNHSETDQRNRTLAAFSLAKATELADGIEQSMPMYEHANALYKSRFSLSDMQREFAARKEGYSSKALNIQALPLDNQPTPIFLVGMPRSGSTLLEQILASHPRIEGTIEQPTLPNIEQQAQQLCMQQYKTDLRSGLSLMNANDLTQLGRSYLEKGRLFRHEHCDYFIDKQPFNYRLIGLIHKILPHAIVIDVRRSPMDCGFSLFKQYFHSGVEFSYSQDDIAGAINAYNGLMTHWHEAIPGRIITVQYESLVREPEDELRNLFDQMGVSYDERCLQFHQNPRTIHTASSEQVREPLHQRSIDAWMHVETRLTALQHNLTD